MPFENRGKLDTSLLEIVTNSGSVYSITKHRSTMSLDKIFIHVTFKSPHFIFEFRIPDVYMGAEYLYSYP